MNKTANRTSWKNSPIERPEKIDLELHFSQAQFLKIIRGLIPEQMEDKWFIFYEDGWLYFHRSWTGFGVFKTQLIKGEKDHFIREFHAEGNPEKYGENDKQKSIQIFVYLIARGLLQVDPAAIYSNPNPILEDPLASWSTFGRMLGSSPDTALVDTIKSLLFGVAVGDALGVPYEFKSRESIALQPATDMTGYGTYNLPAGTFSDDSSLSFCLAEVLTGEFDLQAIANNFINWLYGNYWTATGTVFDVGMATRQSIERLKKGTRPELAGGFEAPDNGNGSLMRILPLVLYIKDKAIEERFERTKQVSSITHAHTRSVIGCFYYLEFARQIMLGVNKFEIYKNLQGEIPGYLRSIGIVDNEITIYDRLLAGTIYELPAGKIHSSGYIVHTLEASIWCLMTTDNYREATLQAVNLGLDTDTTAAVTGGLAGLLYGFTGIPGNWLEQVAKKDDIEDLAERLTDRFANQ